MKLHIIIEIILYTIGEWLNNKANGKGKFYHVDGDIFDGTFSNNNIFLVNN